MVIILKKNNMETSKVPYLGDAAICELRLVVHRVLAVLTLRHGPYTFAISCHAFLIALHLQLLYQRNLVIIKWDTKIRSTVVNLQHNYYHIGIHFKNVNWLLLSNKLFTDSILSETVILKGYLLNFYNGQIFSKEINYIS